MVSTARDLLYRPEPADPIERVISVLPPADKVTAWTDHVVNGYYGRIAVRETRGSGLPVLLIHGESGSKDSFVRQMDGALGARHRMIAVDLPGHGESDDAHDPSGGYTMSGFADAVVDVVEHLGLDRFAILGWSLGGHVALEIATSAPGVVGVMIVGTEPRATQNEILTAASPKTFPALASKVVLSEDEMTSFARWMGIDHEPALLAALRRADGRARKGVLDDRAAGNGSDEHEIVADLSVPLAVVNGANDPTVDLDYVQGLSYRTLWEGRVHAYPLAGHAPFLDAPDVFNAMLARFLHDIERNADTCAATPGLCLAG